MDPKTSVWILRLGDSVAIILSVYIFKKEYNSFTSNPKAIGYQKWLNLFSLSTMILCILTTINYIFTVSPVVCKYPLSFRIIFYASTRCMLTFYQIARLSYCFEQNQIHSKKYGYNKYLFVFLYINGIILILFAAISSFFIFNVHFVEWGCIPIRTDYFNIFVFIWYSWYILWDFFVLFLYIIKICQFNQKQSIQERLNTVTSLSGNKLPDSKASKIKFAHQEYIIMRRIKFILYKILILTLINEIIATSTVYVFFEENTSNLLELLWMFDLVMTSVIIYLMIDHNNGYYMKLIWILNKFRLCCCCQVIVEESIMYNKDSHNIQDNNQTQNDDTIDTKTQNPVPIQMQHYNQHSESSQYY
eukprot:381534_1